MTGPVQLTAADLKIIDIALGNLAEYLDGDTDGLTQIDHARAALDAAQPEQTLVPTETLRALFDCAVNSMDFGSGFWDHEDTTAARAIAVLLGVDPWNATPRDHGVNYPHAFDTPDPDADWAYCRRCRQGRDHRCHHQSADQTATDPAAQP